VTLRTAIGVILGVAAALFGVAAALGVASLPSDWSRVGVVLSLVAAWLLWELLLRVRARAYGGATPTVPSPAADRMAIAIAVLIGLAVVVAVASGWLRL
jgi:hypothetical protein